MRILITGAAGQLGTAFARDLAREHDLCLADRATLDLARPAQVERFVRAVHPDLILNCAAFTHVDRCETQALEAFRINTLAVGVLARLAGAAGACFVHFSTDFVFDGEAADPYREDDAVNPSSAYGLSKLLGEELAARCTRYYVLRLSSLFGGRHRKAYVDRIIEAARAGETLPVFHDRIVSPTHTGDVIRAVRVLVQNRAPSGVYHCTSTGHCSWHRLACEVARLLRRPCAARPVAFDPGAYPARRPRFCALSNNRLRAQGVEIPPWQQTLEKYLKDWTPATAALAGAGSPV